MKTILEKIKSLNRYQKAILLFMLAMVLIFAAVYSRAIAREGYAYKGAILVPGKEGEATLYSGKLNGEQAVFRVLPGWKLIFQYGDRTYGPYVAKEVPEAIPEDTGVESGITGLELYRGEDLLFRGGLVDYGDQIILYEEDGRPADIGVWITGANGSLTDERGNQMDAMEPSVTEILELMTGPGLTHRGSWTLWLEGTFACLLTAVSMLFADELFRWSLSFQIRHAEDAEPSDLEIAGRYFAWTILPLMALILFITGLSVQ